MSEELTGFKLGEAMTAPGYVAVPLDEYKRFLEFQFKGPTIEIPLDEYRRLTEENVGIRQALENAQRDNELLGAREYEARKERDFMLSIEEIIKREVEKIELAVIACIRNMQKGSESLVTESDTMAERPRVEKTRPRSIHDGAVAEPKERG